MVLIGFALVAIGVSFATVLAQQSGDVEMSEISGHQKAPRRHFRLREPGKLAPGEAQQICDIALKSLAAGYARSSVPAAEAYPGWRRYNEVPYLSATHGNRYINDYANDTARAYGSGKRLPVGSIIAKDSFSVTETGGILLGPLFLM